MNGNTQKKSLRADPFSLVMRVLVWGAALLTAGVLLALIAYILIRGVPNLKLSLFELEYNSENVSMFPSIVMTIYMTVLTLIITTPLGIGCAIYLTEYAKRGNKVVEVIRLAAETLSGIPSIVYGLVGMIVLVPLIQKTFSLSSGACLLAAIIVLAIMILPSIINVSETALRAVPPEYEEASLALGATAIETDFRVILPAARSGVATAVVLGVGRAIGEAMAIIMVAGNVANMPGLFTSVRFLTTAIASEMSYAAYGSLQRDALFSVGLVLFLFILLINAALRLLSERSAKA